MKKIITIIIIMFSFFTKGNAEYNQLATDFSFKDIDGNAIKLSDYKDKVIVIVNVASRCGFTNQYADLQKLWTEYNNKGLVVLGIPSNNFRQEPGTNKEIKKFCETTFGINFPITEKLNVIGENADPFFIWAKKNYGSGAVPKWNFHKIIVGKNGKIVETFASITKPSSKKFISAIEKEIKN
ncbi:glutathione peroxidase [Pelagibacteraceae bacterium]|jgi:glutathione peroxidase|nr:glutathione peroxidase [Pelagibacteraceae bacterium]